MGLAYLIATAKVPIMWSLSRNFAASERPGSRQSLFDDSNSRIALTERHDFGSAITQSIHTAKDDEFATSDGYGATESPKSLKQPWKVQFLRD